VLAEDLARPVISGAIRDSNRRLPTSRPTSMAWGPREGQVGPERPDAKKVPTFGVPGRPFDQQWDAPTDRAIQQAFRISAARLNDPLNDPLNGISS
jgi:hypothetical protein